MSEEEKDVGSGDVPDGPDGTKEEEEKMSGGKKKPEGEAQGPSALPPDEYTPLVDDLAQVVTRGRESYQEDEVPGRSINYAAGGMESRTILVCQTNKQGVPELTVTGTIEGKRQRIFIGARAEASTKGHGERSANLAPYDTIVKPFEVSRQAHGLVEGAIRAAQDDGEEIQQRIDEKDYQYFPPLARTGQETIVNLDAEADGIDLNVVRQLVATAWQELKRRLGTKAAEIDVVFIRWTENYIYADTEGARVSYVVPRLSLSAQVKTKSGSEAFGCLRGAGGTIEQIFTRDDAYRGQTPLEAVKTLAAEVAKEAVDLDRAQRVNAVGTEFYVVFGPKVSGVFVHEVMGHPMEGDIIDQNRWNKEAGINLKARFGAQVSTHKGIQVRETGSPEIDLGGGRIIRYGFGSMVVDQRGDPAKEVVLVEGGTQLGAMTDRHCYWAITDGIPEAILERMGRVGLTGNARAEKYDKPIIVRMRNTVLCPDPNGPKSLEEAAARIPTNKKGILIVTCEGGWVDPDGGDFAVLGKLGYLIESGHINWDKPIKEISVQGNITSFGDQIVAVGSGETITGTFPGYCGKDGQRVPVDGTGPILLIRDVKAVSFQRPRWIELVRDYQRQHDEVVEGTRRKKDIHFSSIAETAVEDQGCSHANICVVTIRFASAQEEIDYVLGLNEHADFVAYDDEQSGKRQLRSRRDPYA